MSVDVWGEPVAADFTASIAAWNDAWAEFNHFVGDPFATLANANRTDDSFVMGPLFCATYLVLGGSPAGNPELVREHQRALSRAQTNREFGHIAALDHLVAGDFTKAAQQWDAVAANDTDGQDFSAVRFAHDAYLHVGDAQGRLSSSQAAFDRWERDRPGWSYVASQLSFAFEEAGDYDAAIALGHEALEADPLDLWALHSLAHVYESLDDSATAIGVLRERQEVWAKQDSLAVHIWWHLALRLLAIGEVEEVLAIHDQQIDEATTAFRLSDLVSMLWRLELAGAEVGDRWDELADRFADLPQWHTSGFLDLHAAFVYARRPSHPSASRFFDGVEASHPHGHSENDRTFLEVVKPLVAAVRNGETSPAASAAVLNQLAPTLHRIGGSIAQRDVISLTSDHLSTVASLADPHAPETT